MSSGKTNRKFGRNKQFCERYRAECRREKNKAAKLRKHLAKYPDDVTAQQALEATGY